MAELITAIDLGTSKVCVIIAEVDKNGQLQIIGLGKSPCNGIKKGVVVDIESTTKSILEAVEQAENMADLQIDEACINIPGGYCNVLNNKGVIAVSSEDKEITYDDIKRVLNSAAIISIPQDQQIIDIIPYQYIVDGYDEIKDPIGMVGTRLEVDADIITASVTTVQNLIKSVNKAGIEVLGILMEPLGTSEAVLTNDEKELGVLLIDIGAGTSDYTLFKNNRLIYSNIIPIGGNHITNDISIGLRISYKESEEKKRRFGLAYSELANQANKIEISPIGTYEQIKTDEVELSKIIEARVEEIFELIETDLIKRGIKDEILTGIVITGGGVGYLRGIIELGKKVFGLPIRLAHPNHIGAREPVYSTTVGLIEYTYKRKFKFYIDENNVESKKGRYKTKMKNSKNVVQALKRIWDEYF